VSLFGLSKIFAITGWRMGYAVAPRPLAEALLLANDLFFICAPRPLQHGVASALAELDADWYRRRAAAFEGKRDRLCGALRDAGFGPIAPQGSYYVFTDVRPRGYESAREAAMELLETTGVATVPGTAFFQGPEGEHYLRVCFAKEDPVLDEACERIRGG
jgi:aminotransferase